MEMEPKLVAPPPVWKIPYLFFFFWTLPLIKELNLSCNLKQTWTRYNLDLTRPELDNKSSPLPCPVWSPLWSHLWSSPLSPPPSPPSSISQVLSVILNVVLNVIMCEVPSEVPFGVPLHRTPALSNYQDFKKDRNKTEDVKSNFRWSPLSALLAVFALKCPFWPKKLICQDEYLILAKRKQTMPKIWFNIF